MNAARNHFDCVQRVNRNSICKVMEENAELGNVADRYVAPWAKMVSAFTVH